MKTGWFQKNISNRFRANLLRLCFVLMVSLFIAFMFSVNVADGARKIISWMSMFSDARAYEEAMRSSGVLKYDVVQDATDMLADEKAYERDARAFIDESIKNRGSKNDYVMERDLNEFHEKRLKELQRKWSRSNYLVECATKMAESVRDSSLVWMKSVMAEDKHRAVESTNVNNAGTTTYLAPEERKVIGLVERATVFIVVIYEREQKVGIGTGFFVAPGIIITNRHVVSDKDAKVAVFSKALGRPTTAQIVAISDRKERDYTLLRAGYYGDVSPLVFSTDAKSADKVTAWGFPYIAIASDPQFETMMQGDIRSAPDAVFSEGVVGSIQNQDPPLVLHNAFLSNGSSGGPLVNAKGQVLGINTSGVFNRAHRQSGIAICAADIIKFMQENGITPKVISSSR